MSARTLLVVSASLPRGIAHRPNGPRKDYLAIADRLGADVLDWSDVRKSPRWRLLAKAIGVARVQAFQAFLRRARYDVIVTDGEHNGLPLALLLTLTRSRVPHVTIGHRISVAKKRPFFRWLRVQSHLDAVMLHSRYQYELALAQHRFAPEQRALVPYRVDPEVWRVERLMTVDQFADRIAQVVEIVLEGTGSPARTNGRAAPPPDGLPWGGLPWGPSATRPPHGPSAARGAAMPGGVPVPQRRPPPLPRGPCPPGIPVAPPPHGPLSSAEERGSRRVTAPLS